MNSDQTGGGGLCSPKLTPWLDWKSACYDSDYFDGTPPAYDTLPAEWFRSVWERDFPIMADLGVNTLRVYNANPTTLLATQELLPSGWNSIVKPYGKDHRPFFDLAHAYGFRIVFPLVTDETALTVDSDELLDQKIKYVTSTTTI